MYPLGIKQCSPLYHHIIPTGGDFPTPPQQSSRLLRSEGGNSPTLCSFISSELAGRTTTADRARCDLFLRRAAAPSSVASPPPTHLSDDPTRPDQTRALILKCSSFFPLFRPRSRGREDVHFLSCVRRMNDMVSVRRILCSFVWFLLRRSWS